MKTETKQPSTKGEKEIAGIRKKLLLKSDKEFCQVLNIDTSTKFRLRKGVAGQVSTRAVELVNFLLQFIPEKEMSKVRDLTRLNFMD